MSSRKQNSKPHNFEVAQYDPFAAFKFRDYRLFTIGRLVLFVGSQMQTVAISWELYERTNSAIALGGLGLAQVLPMIILTLIAGDVADRRDAYGGLRLRKVTMLLSVMLLALCSQYCSGFGFLTRNLVWGKG